jgi:hypothetical protein
MLKLFHIQIVAGNGQWERGFEVFPTNTTEYDLNAE